MPRLTRRAVEKAILERMGMSVRLHRDPSGYYYFYSDDKETDIQLARWPSTSVYVYRLNQFTLEQWLLQFTSLKEEGNR